MKEVVWAGRPGWQRAWKRSPGMAERMRRVSLERIGHVTARVLPSTNAKGWHLINVTCYLCVAPKIGLGKHLVVSWFREELYNVLVLFQPQSELLCELCGSW